MGSSVGSVEYTMGGDSKRICLCIIERVIPGPRPSRCALELPRRLVAKLILRSCGLNSYPDSHVGIIAVSFFQAPNSPIDMV